VITQIERPPYCKPRDSLDLVPLEIIFDHIFEAFCWMLQAKADAVATAPAGDDNSLPKRACRAPLVKKIMGTNYIF
jgi:hypothetical protein